MDPHRRRFATLAGASLALAALPTRAQTVPEVARILAGFAAGGTVDVTARRVADRLRDGYAKSVIVDNRTGAGGQIALGALKSATPDGLTVALTPMSMLGIYPHTYRKLPYDPVADFLPVSQAVRFDFGFAVGPMVPANVRTVAEFSAWAKAHPRDANFGSPAAGSVPHFVGELFGRSVGIDLRHTPYRGTQPAILDLMGGQVAAVSGPVGEFLQHLPTGKVRLLATSGLARSRFTPTVPTFAEQGLKDLVHDEWFGFYVPARTPTETVARLNAAISAALAAPEVVESLANMGLEAKPSSPAELAALLKKDGERWAPLIQTLGFTAES
ncbi:MAG: Bug family tripartite tricarboxylate transporter substrate binding protein [Burkholderiales bacterium]|jgi:tripartite-type tricarboxylate transporter receptor subunit TctC